MKRMTDSPEDWLPDPPPAGAVQVAKRILLEENRDVLIEHVQRRSVKRFLQLVSSEDMAILLAADFEDMNDSLDCVIYFLRGEHPVHGESYHANFMQEMKIIPPLANRILANSEEIDKPVLAAFLIHDFRDRMHRWMKHNVEKQPFEIDVPFERNGDHLLEANMSRLKLCYDRILNGTFGVY